MSHLLSRRLLFTILHQSDNDATTTSSPLPEHHSIHLPSAKSARLSKEILKSRRLITLPMFWLQSNPKFNSRNTLRACTRVPSKNQNLKRSKRILSESKREQGRRNKIQLTPSVDSPWVADEDAMDKEVAVKVKDHKRKHDSDDEEDDDDDEGPSAGSNQGRSAKRRRPESAASGSAPPPSKDDVVNSLMHMLLNNIQITDTSLMHMLNLNPSPHKEDSLVLLSEIPLLCQRR
ncbi:hypothetical protein Tco_0106110, partial [Tanacetum coccineum]